MTGAFADGLKGSGDDQEGVLTIRLHDIPLRALVVLFHYFYSNTLPSNLATFLTPFARPYEEEEEEEEEEDAEFVVLVEVLACANMLGVDAVVNECQGRMCDTLNWTIADIDNVSVLDHGGKGTTDHEGMSAVAVDDDREGVVVSASASPWDADVEAVVTTLSLALTYDCGTLALRCRMLLRR